ncbi:MAG: ATP-binding protein [Ignavibacteriaceae bacterium]
MESSRKIKLFILADVVFYLFCCLGILFISQKAALPFKIVSDQGEFRFQNPYDYEVSHNSSLISIDNLSISSLEKIEFILDGFNIGDTVLIKFRDDLQIRTAYISLIEYYDSVYFISAFITGTIFFIFGLFILIKLNANEVSQIFHFMTISVAGIIMLSWGKYSNTFLETGYVTRILFHFAYLLTPAMFLHFALMFPRDRRKKNVALLKTTYYISILLAALVNIFFSIAVNSYYDTAIDSFVIIFDLLRIFIIIFVIASISVFVYSLYVEKSETERKKLKWILTGFFIGPVSFILFWVIPQLMGIEEPFSEEIIILLSNAIPVTFAIAIVKYHLLDIDHILNRGIVYVLVLSILVLIYVALPVILLSLFKISDDTIVSLLSVVLIALLFLPVKAKVQGFVDKKFFRIKYNYRLAINNILSSIKNFNDAESLYKFIIHEIDTLIPVERIGIFEIDPTNKLLILAVEKDLSIYVKNNIIINADKLQSLSSKVIARKDIAEKEAIVSIEYNNLLNRYKLALVVPLVLDENQCFGLIILGNKLSGLKFTVEDIDLLKNIASTAAVTIERIKLQERLISERIAAAKLEELNKQKSLYVSAVTHDLTVPLTSIKLFTEMILDTNVELNEQVKKHLNIIDTETGRLSRLVTNILDISKIERGTKSFNLCRIDLNSVVEELLDAMERQILHAQFNLNVFLERQPLNIIADPDAVKQALQNLINNSLRYSTSNKSIAVKTFSENGYGCVLVKDHGKGIPEDEFQNIFKPYYRNEKDDFGIGLGLYIVKHIIDAHKGRTEIKSTLGAGTKIILKFPLNN